MQQKIQSVRGMNDLLPQDSRQYNAIKTIINDILINYGYDYIRTPIVENTTTFKRAIGTATDIVAKEMYSWKDGKENLSLRPEGTAGVVRAMIEHNLPREGVQKVFYYGPMFRHERPQKGRYRQFFQFGAEVFGLTNPKIDAELIVITTDIWQKLGIQTTLEINSLGTNVTREKYQQILLKYLLLNKDKLDNDSLKRLNVNPLRILDSKNKKMASLINNAPKLIDYLDDESKQEFDQLLVYLKELNIQYTINPTLVRGLDYYNKTVFEWTSEELGTQSTICAGGRYDNLVEKMGGLSVPAIGFAIGMERLLLITNKNLNKKNTSFYLISSGKNAQIKSMLIAQKIRANNLALILYNDCSDASFKAQFKKADKKNADYALIIGENEVKNNQIMLKQLKVKKPQETIKDSQIINFLKRIL